MGRNLHLESDKMTDVVQAAEGAKKAREWISDWREGKTKGMTVRSTVHCVCMLVDIKRSHKVLEHE